MSEERWIVRLRDELRVLPDTLEALRVGVHDLRAVARRLEAVTEVIERTQRHMENSGAAQFARDVDDAVASVGTELAQLRERMPSTPSGAFASMMEQTEASVDQLMRLAIRLQQSFDTRDRPDGP
ncbi:MAG: hypothetical protein ACR2QE_12140 [Acidimicrobiales bacterium]